MTTKISNIPHIETGLHAHVHARHSALILLLVTLLIAIAPYHYLWQRGFTDSDDFEEVDRAISVDVAQPDRIFLTAHEGNRYRPLNRALNAATAELFGAAPAGYLLRNLAFHVINTALLFGIVYLLFRNALIGAAAGALFAVHPANVNSVSIAVFTQAFSTTLLLLGLLLFVQHLLRSSSGADWRPFVAALLFVGITFSSEMFLWVGPVYLLALAWIYLKRGRQADYLLAFGVMLGGMLLYGVLRQAIVDVTAVSTPSPDSRYGLQTPGQVVRNVGMFLVSSGVAVDYLHFIDPATQILPITLDRLPSVGLTAAIGSGLFISLATIAGASLGVQPAASLNLRIAALFVALFFASIAIVNLMTTASETHTYPSNALLIVAQAALLNEVMLNSSARSRSVRVAGVSGLIAVLIVCRAVGVEHRNLALQRKFEWVAAVQSQARDIAADAGRDQLAFVIACDIPAGYSVYGLNRLELLSDRSFMKLTLGNQSSRIQAVSYEQFQSGADLAKLPMHTVLVDRRGMMHVAAREPVTLDCAQ